MRRVEFNNGIYYHLFNRGVERRQIFVDNEDCVKFLEYMRKFKDSKDKPYLDISSKPQVSCVCYVLSRDHFHLVVRQENEDGITNFMHALSTAFSMYYNRKYKRRGRLFEGPFRAKPIHNFEQMLLLSKRIHLCPLQYFTHQDHAERIKFLRGYLWSSYQDFVGLRDGTLCKKKILLNTIEENDPEGYYKKFAEMPWTEPEKQIVNEVVLE